MLIKAEKKLTKIYGSGKSQVVALKEADLEIAQGEFVSIMGSSGSGKSTLLHLLSGLDRLTSGSLSYDGKDIYGLKDKELSVFRGRDSGRHAAWFPVGERDLACGTESAAYGYVSGTGYCTAAGTDLLQWFREMGIFVVERFHHVSVCVSGGGSGGQICGKGVSCYGDARDCEGEDQEEKAWDKADQEFRKILCRPQPAVQQEPYHDHGSILDHEHHCIYHTAGSPRADRRGKPGFKASG